MNSERQKQEDETSEVSTEESTLDWNIFYEDHRYRYMRLSIAIGAMLILQAFVFLGFYKMRSWAYAPKLTYAGIALLIIFGVMSIFFLMHILSRHKRIEKIAMQVQIRERERKLLMEVEKDIDAILRQGMPNGR